MPLHSRYARKKRPARSPDDALVLAARRGDIGGLRAALDAGAANLGEALARAIRSDRPLAVAYLLDRGADPNALIWFGQFFEMPLIFAVACGRIACAEALVDHGAWLAACQDQPLGPLHWAVENGSLRMMRALLARGADVNDGTWDNYHWGEELWEGLTCLEIAARRNRLGIARALLDAGARTEPPADREEAGPPGSGRSTALEDAARHPQGDKLFQLLLERGATDPDGRALAIAVERGDVAKAKLLLAAGAPIQQRPLNKLREKLLFRGEATRRHDAVLAVLRERGYKPGHREIAARRWRWLLGRAAPDGILQAGCLILFALLILVAFGFAFAAMLQAKRFSGRAFAEPPDARRAPRSASAAP